MPKPYEQRLVMMVAQAPFSVDVNRFCKALPLIYSDGSLANESEFPNNGEIWWMLNHTSERLASPGNLIVGRIEDADRFEETDSEAAQFQISRESVSEFGPSDGFEIIDLEDHRMSRIDDLVRTDFEVPHVARPAPSVFVRWEGYCYGPFKTRSRIAPDSEPQHMVAFETDPADPMVLRVSAKAFTDATQGRRFSLKKSVSITQVRRSQATPLTPVKREILFRDALERVRVVSEKVRVEALERKLVLLAKVALTRARRREFRSMLDEIELSLATKDDRPEADLLSALETAKGLTDAADQQLTDLAAALMKAGLLGEDRIEKAEKRVAEEYVKSRAAEFEAKVQERVSDRREDLQKLEKEIASEEARWEAEKARKREALEQELNGRVLLTDADIRSKRIALDQEREILEHELSAARQTLQGLVSELEDGGQRVVRQFLAIVPLLKDSRLFALGGFPPSQVGAQSPATDLSEDGPAPARDFEVPRELLTIRQRDRASPSEEEFFERFQRLVEDVGFAYRPVDLQRFHLSVKTGGITVLGGPSWTGKSSLPQLYSTALRGDETRSDRVDCLMIGVSPGWMDTRDLLGHLNALDRQYYPSSTGLLEYLLTAQEEHHARKEGSGIYACCLDEMNLAQVEHYFSDFISVLERPGPSRAITCFSAESISSTSPFRKWPHVWISPAVRFIGTVNFDETTRLLSDRLLDRTNLITLDPAGLPDEAEHLSDRAIRATGPEITLRDLADWTNDTALPSELAAILDSIRPHLRMLGCPISPRTYRGIRRFVASSEAILPRATAFDLQMAQRLVPRIRPPRSRASADALDRVVQLLSESSVGQFSETLSLLETIRDDQTLGSWDLED